MKKHILILSSWFPTSEKPFLGNFVEYQAALLTREYRVSFLRLLPLGSPAPSEKKDSFRYVNVFYNKSKNPFFTFFSKRTALKKALPELGKVDVIHAHVSHPSGWMFRFIKKRLKKPLIVTEHGSYFRKDRKWSRRMNYTIASTIKQADVLVAVSSLLAEDIKQRFPGRRIEVIGNPVDTKLFHVVPGNAGNVRFLHISTLDSIKNVKPILQAFSKVREIHPSVQLTIVSDEDHSFYSQMAEQLEIKDAVSFEGPVTHEKIPAYYWQSDCLVMNSLYETFSIVIAEAWASGIPVISTPVGIAFEMPPELGFLTDGTEQCIEQAMVSIIENQCRFDAEVIRKHAESYSVDNFLTKINRIYQPFF